MYRPRATLNRAESEDSKLAVSSCSCRQPEDFLVGLSRRVHAAASTYRLRSLLHLISDVQPPEMKIIRPYCALQLLVFLDIDAPDPPLHPRLIRSPTVAQR